LVWSHDGYLAGATVGVFQGAWRTILRGAAGIFEVATFYLEIPKGFEPLIRPEFVLGYEREPGEMP
jgi:putative exosortase-associated protein (TIGR04073 family)